METTAKKEKVFKTLGIIGNVFLWIIVAFSILTTIFVIASQNNKDGVPELFGKSFITIETNSMEPTYEVGDMVFMEKLSDEEKTKLTEKDIITFRVDLDGDGKRELNTHRIVRIEGNSIYTKGDHPDAPEDTNPVAYGDIIGKCTEKGKIGGLGGVMNFLRSSLGFFLCVVLPMLLFFLYELYNFISLLVARKAANAPVSAETEEEIKRKAIEEYLAQQAAANGETATQAAPDAVDEAPAEGETNEENASAGHAEE